jgi:photosystem II stability/assembly factor-like uncharacterized protein
MKKYIVASICAISLLAASCTLFEPAKGGVLKTANGGVDWQSSNKIKNNNKSEIGSLSISRLDFDPQRTDVLFASATNSGMYMSSDGGGSWEEILGTIPIHDFAINPIDSKIIYAAGAFDNKARALATRDAGKSWNEIFNEDISGSSVRSVAVNPSNPQQVILGLSHGGVVLSNDSGATWKALASHKDRINKIIWRNEGIYLLVRNKGVYRSTDGGGTFTHLTANMKSSVNQSQSSVFGSSISSYSQFDVSKQDPNVMFAATNSGLYRSDNAGASWGFVSMPLKQSQLSPNSVAIAPNSSSVVYVGAGSTIYKTTDGGNTWLTSDTGTKNQINALLVSPELPQVAFAGVSAK